VPARENKGAGRCLRLAGRKLPTSHRICSKGTVLSTHELPAGRTRELQAASVGAGLARVRDCACLRGSSGAGRCRRLAGRKFPTSLSGEAPRGRGRSFRRLELPAGRSRELQAASVGAGLARVRDSACLRGRTRGPADACGLLGENYQRRSVERH
jgi:hypothetical protein